MSKEHPTDDEIKEVIKKVEKKIASEGESPRKTTKQEPDSGGAEKDLEKKTQHVERQSKQERKQEPKEEKKETAPPKKEPTLEQLSQDIQVIKTTVGLLTKGLVNQQTIIESLRSGGSSGNTSSGGREGQDNPEQEVNPDEVETQEEVQRLQEEQARRVEEAQKKLPGDAPGWAKYALPPLIETIKSVAPVVIEAMRKGKSGSAAPMEVARQQIRDSVGFVNDTLKTIDTIRGTGVQDLFKTLKEAPKEYKERFFSSMLGTSPSSPSSTEHVHKSNTEHVHK